MFKKIKYLIVLIVPFLLFSQVNAQEYYDVIDEHGMWIANEFIVKEKNGSRKYQQMSKIIRKSDGRFLYCIEPGKSIEKNKAFTGYDTSQQEYANLNDSQWARIRLLAYYGYGYSDSNVDHSDIKWYVITQYMIWKTNDLGYDIYFTDTLNGNRIDKYISEINELENLVNSHFVTPSFVSGTKNVFIDQVTEFTDTNNVLEKYNVECSSTNYCFTNKNWFDIKITNPKDENYVVFTKKLNLHDNEPIVYIDDTNQNLLLPGRVPEVVARLNLNVTYGKVSLKKYDNETKKNAASGDATLEDAEYGLYTNSNSLLEIRKTNSNGNINFTSKLKAGKYYVKELTPSEGYNLDTSKYSFEISATNSNIDLKVYEDIIKEEFEIIKIVDNNKTGLSEFEKNIDFGVYDKNNNLINTYITDSNGTIKFKLNYGVYTLKQHTVYEDYEMIDNYILDVKEHDKFNKLVFKDRLKSSNIKKESKNEMIYDPQIVGSLDNNYVQDDEVLEVSVPNTYKDDNSSIYYILFLIIIKKLWLF